MNAIITDIKKFAVHDGNGIRTTVFFKGCPLRCIWCHNPETILKQYQIGFYNWKCVLCGACVEVCKNHTITGNNHIFNREECTGCGKCSNVCTTGALVLYGREMSVEEISEKLLEDIEFYKISNGGITLSGGECLLQSDVCREILINMKEKCVNTAVDTCGMVEWNNIEKVIDYTDIFLYDIKAFDEDVHKRCTGVSNKLILENLKRIDDCGKAIEIRIPYIPGYNNNQINKIVDFISGLKNVINVRILPYHDFARSKYNALNIKDTLPTRLPDDEELLLVHQLLKKYNIAIDNF